MKKRTNNVIHAENRFGIIAGNSPAFKPDLYAKKDKTPRVAGVALLIAFTGAYLGLNALNKSDEDRIEDRAAEQADSAELVLNGQLILNSGVAIRSDANRTNLRGEDNLIQRLDSTLVVENPHYFENVDGSSWYTFELQDGETEETKLAFVSSSILGQYHEDGTPFAEIVVPEGQQRHVSSNE